MTPWPCPKNSACYSTDTCPALFIGILFATARKWDHTSTDGETMKMCQGYAMEYYLTVKRNELMKFAGKWIDVENTILNEVTQDPERETPPVCSHSPLVPSFKSSDACIQHGITTQIQKLQNRPQVCVGKR